MQGVPATKYLDAAAWREGSQIIQYYVEEGPTYTIMEIQIITFIHVPAACASLPIERCSVAAMVGSTRLLSAASSSS